MWHLSSRVHKLNHFPNDGVACYVKRDDELGCGISGTKMRKYASLMPILVERGIRHLIIIAGPQSNNLLAALQMARESKMRVTAFLIQSRHQKIQGNYKLSRLFLHEHEIVWIDRKDWPRVDELANAYLANLTEAGFILSEGASVPEAMYGAMTLAADIVRNEHSMELDFNHIFIDAGTGFSAAALIKGLAELNHQARIYVLLLADDEMLFRSKLVSWLGAVPERVSCLYPETARSFGSLNQTIKDAIKRMALEEGILAEPVYSAKLFHTARMYIEKNKLKGTALIVHSGGILTMAGFDFG